MKTMPMKREKWRNYQKERRAKLHAEGRCICCGKQDKRTAAGRTMCEKCAQKQNVRTQRYKAKVKQLWEGSKS